MENNKEVLEKLEKHSRQQLTLTKILCVFCALSMVCMLVLTISITGVAREIVSLAAPLQDVAIQIQNLSTEAQTVMHNMDTVVQALVDADLGGMANSLNILATDSQTVVTEAMKKLDTIDIDTLNRAITDLADAAEILGRVSRIFG